MLCEINFFFPYNSFCDTNNTIEYKFNSTRIYIHFIPNNINWLFHYILDLFSYKNLYAIKQLKQKNSQLLKHLSRRKIRY